MEASLCNFLHKLYLCSKRLLNMSTYNSCCVGSTRWELFHIKSIQSLNTTAQHLFPLQI